MLRGVSLTLRLAAPLMMRLPSSSLRIMQTGATIVRAPSCSLAAIAATFAAAHFSTSSVLLGRPGRKFMKRPRESKPGDWTCQCGAVMGRMRRECIKCNSPAPPLPPGVVRPKLPGEDPNDWACPCGQMNYRGNVNCHKCNMPKPVTPAAPGAEVTLWTCKRCKGVNRSFRKFCFKCGAPPNASAPSPPAAKAAASSESQAPPNGGGS